MPTASIDFTLAALAIILVLVGSVYGVNMAAEPYMEQELDEERYNQIGKYLLLSQGAPANWGTGAVPTVLGLASGGDSYELDIDKVTRLNPSNAYSVDYSDLWQALGIEDVSFNIEVDYLFSLSLDLSSSEIQGGDTLHSFDVSTTRDGYPIPSDLRYYAVIGNSTYTKNGATDGEGSGSVEFSLPNSLSGTALLIGFARAEESIFTYGVLPFAHNTGAPAAGGTYATLSPLDYELSVDLVHSTSSTNNAFYTFDRSSNELACDTLTEAVSGSYYEQVTVSVEQSTGSTGWTDVPGASVSFTPGSSSEEWLVFVTADIRSDSTSEDSARFRYDIGGTPRGETGVQQGTTSTSPIDPYNVYFHFSRVTGVSSKQTVKFQYQASFGVTAYTRNIHILCVRLDWAGLEYTEVNGDTSITGLQTLATLQFTPSSSSDYIVAYCALVSEEPLGTTGAETWLDYDYGTTLAPDAWSIPNTKRIHTDRDQFEPHGLFSRFSLDATQHTFRVRGQLDTPGDTSTARDVRVAAFRVDAFDLLEYDEDTTPSSTTGDNTVRSVVTTADPGEEREYLILSGIHTISDGTSSREAGGIEIDDAFVQRKGDERFPYADIARIASHHAYVHTASSGFKVETTFGRGGTGLDTVYSKQSVIYVLKMPQYATYMLDLEVQWTDIADLTGADLAVYSCSSSGSEGLRVDCWDEGGGQWVTLGNLNQNSWSNYTVTPYLTSPTLTVRFKGTSESDDATQDSWRIDVSLLRLSADGSEDPVDNDTSDVDSSPDVGTHSNFPAQKSGPDSFTLTRTGWLSGWDRRLVMTIDHDDVDGDLTNFPVLIHLSSSSGRDGDDVSFVFDELQSDANRKRIAVTTSDGTTQCYVEIEEWDDAGEEAWLWVKVPAVDSSKDTMLYLYYDASHSDNTDYVGDSGSAMARNVWDDDYVGVWHLPEDPEGAAPQMKNSKSDDHHGSCQGFMDAFDQVRGQIDGSLDLDGFDDHIDFGSSESLDITGDITIEFWLKADDYSNFPDIVTKGTYDESYSVWLESDGDIVFSLNNDRLTSLTSVSTTYWNYVAVTRIGSDRRIFINGTEDTSDVYGASIGTVVDPLTVSSTDYPFDGIVDDTRLSSKGRLAPWIKACYESGVDDMLDFGEVETWDDYDEFNVTFPRLLDGSPVVLVLTGVNATSCWAEWVAYPQVPITAGADMSDDYVISDVVRVSYLVEINGGLYRFEVRFRSPAE